MRRREWWLTPPHSYLGAEWMADSVTERVILAPAIRGARTIVAPFQVQILQGDTLSIAVCGASLGIVSPRIQISYRMLAPNGEVTSSREVIAVTLDYVVRRHTLPLSEGFLLSMSVHPLFTVLQGALWVQASVTRTSGLEDLYLMPLLQGYPTISQVVCWPGSPLMQQSDGQWYPRSIVPAVNAGLDWSTTVPVGAQWRVTAAHAILTTSAAVANRQLLFYYTNFAGLAKFRATYGPAQTASLARTYAYGISTPHASGFSFDGFVDGIPGDLILIGGDLVRTFVLNIDAGDSWTQVSVQVLERLSFV
jgi:hypothetical protein